jgi:hypothetical protein
MFWKLLPQFHKMLALLLLLLLFAPTVIGLDVISPPEAARTDIACLIMNQVSFFHSGAFWVLISWTFFFLWVLCCSINFVISNFFVSFITSILGHNIPSSTSPDKAS